MWADGCSASMIGRELCCTRNAVIGKVHRLGLHRGHRSPVVQKARIARRPRKRLFQVLKESGVEVERGAANLPTEPPPDQSVYSSAGRKPVLIENLRAEDCRWPINEGDRVVGFCGNPRLKAEIGHGLPCPYCDGHARIAYLSPLEKQRMKKMHTAVRKRWARIKQEKGINDYGTA